jgi:hypothetical protein
VARWSSPWPGGEGKVPGAYQEEKGRQEPNQEEKGKPEANHNSPASSSSLTSRSHLQISSQQVDNLAHHLSPLIHETMHDRVQLGIPQSGKEVLSQAHHRELLLKPNSYKPG